MLLVALLMLWKSTTRLFFPLDIQYDQAIWIAVLSLLVNLLCAALRHHDDHHQSVNHDQQHSHAHHHAEHIGQDLNHRAAFIHVLADAMTSVFAIVALLIAKFFAWNWLDPVLGLVGAVLVGVWACGLIRQTAKTLLDAENNHSVAIRLSQLLVDFTPKSLISDLHVWQVGKNKFCCIVGLQSTQFDLSPDMVRAYLRVIPELVHISVEINLQQAHVSRETLLHTQSTITHQTPQ